MDDLKVQLPVDSVTTRRKVMATGAKVAYAAPIIAASFKLSTSGAAALSPGCTAGTCAEPVRCSPGRCACREVDGLAQCLQQIRCSDAKVCASTSECGAGYVCLTSSCCIDTLNRCVPICGTDTKSSRSSEAEGDDWVLGAGI